MTTNYGGGFGGFGGFGGGGNPDADRRRREIQQMANVGTSALLKEPPRVTQSPPPMPREKESRKADDAGIISTGLNSVYKMMDWWDSNITKPSAALGLSMLPAMSFIEGEDARVQRSRNVVSSALSGGISMGQAWDRLENIQNERPLALQIGSELLIDPLNVVPFGAFTKPGRAAVRGVRSLGRRTDDIAERTAAGIAQEPRVIPGEVTDPAARSYLSLPNSDDITARINHTAFRERLGKIPGLGRLVGLVAPHTVMDLSDPAFNADRFISHKLIYDEMIEDKVRVELANIDGKWGRNGGFIQDAEGYLANPEIRQDLINKRIRKGRLDPRDRRFMDELPRYLKGDINQAEMTRLTGLKNAETLINDGRLAIAKAMATDRRYASFNIPADITKTKLRELFNDNPGLKTQIDSFLNNPRSTRYGNIGREAISDSAAGRVARQAEDVGREGRVTLNEVAQFPDRYNLTPNQRGWLDDMNKLFNDMRDYVISENADPKELLLGDVKGRYFPNLWMMTKNIDDVRKGNLDPSIFGRKKFFENTRIYDYASDAVDAGWNPGDIGQTMMIYLKGMYQMVAERRLADDIGTWSPALAKRLASNNNKTLDELLENMGPLSKAPAEVIAKIKKGLNTKSNAWVEGTYKASTAMRTLQATMDLGAPLLHGLPILLTAPRVWTKSVQNSIGAMFNDEVFDKFVNNHIDTIRKLNDRNQLHGAGIDAIEAIGREGFLTRVLERGQDVRGIGKPAGYAKKGLGLVERQFESFLLASKVLLWESLEDTALTHAQKRVAKFGGDLATETHKALDDLASHVAKTTGTVSMANLGLRPSRRKVMAGFFMFAPRYRMASYGLMADIFNGGMFGGAQTTASSLSGDLARKRLSGMLMAGLFYHTYIARRMGQEPNIDPSSGDFLTVELPGGQNVGFGSVWVSTARFLAGVTDVSMDDPLADIVGKKFNDRPLTRFVRGQIAPISGTGWDIITGRNFIGDPMPESFLSGEGLLQLGDYGLPFWASGVWDHPNPGWSASHIGGAVLPTAAGEFLGLRTFPTSVWEQATDVADQVSNKMYGANYEDLRRLEQEKVREANPKIQELYDQSDIVFAARGNETRKQMSELRSEQRRIKVKYRDALTELAARWNRPLHSGTDARLLGKEFRDRMSVLGQGIGREYDDLETRFPDAWKALNEEAQNPAARVEDVAYNDYIAELVVKEFTFPDSDEYDYEARRAAERKFRNKWGESLWGYIMERKNHDIPPQIRELKEGRAILQPYWEMGDLIIDKMNMSNMRPIWKEYQQLPVFEQKELEELYPVLRQIRSAVSKGRQMLREQNQSIDAFAFKYGYTDILRHPENMLLGEEGILRNGVDVRW